MPAQNLEVALENEDKYPTIREYADWLALLVDQGLGELPVQVLVAPGLTVQAVARILNGETGEPALMVQAMKHDGIGPNLVDADYLHSSARVARVQ